MMRGLAEYCIYTSISSHVRGCSHDFLLQDPSGLEKSKGRTTRGGRPGSASSTSRTTRETSSSRSSLSAPACARPTSLPPFFPHRTQTHRRESPRCFPRPVHVVSKCYFSKIYESHLLGAVLVRRDPPCRACCAWSPVGRAKKGSRRWLGLQQ